MTVDSNGRDGTEILGYRTPGVLGRGTELADLFLQVRVNGDLGLFQVLNHELVRRHDAGPGSAVVRSRHRRQRVRGLAIPFGQGCGFQP